MENSYYHLTLILRVLKKEEEEKFFSEIKGFLEKKGKIIKIKSLGRKIFAYPLKKEKEGDYFLLTLEMAEKKGVKELAQRLKLKEIVLRHLFVKLSPKEIRRLKEEKEE